MCKQCVINHLANIISATKLQLHANNPKELTLEVPPTPLCAPYAKNAVPYKGNRTFVFPGSPIGDARRFAVMLRVCSMILQNLMENSVVTTRDIYYKDVATFRSQREVVRTIDRLVRMLEVPRSALNVVASPHGLLAGTLTIVMQDGEVVDTNRANGATLIPVGEITYVSAETRPRFILVVEKEAVFTHLQSELKNGIIVTGRGFPDRATRNLLRALAVSYPQAPMYGLVDSDPHGILILRNYETGSVNTYEPEFSLNMQFLGVSILEYTQGLTPLTSNDMRVAISTLKKDWIHEKKYTVCKQELQRGLFMGLKGEMNLLDVNQSERLSAYVKNKMCQVRREELFCSDNEEDLSDFDETLIDLTQTHYDQRSFSQQCSLSQSAPKRQKKSSEQDLNDARL